MPNSHDPVTDAARTFEALRQWGSSRPRVWLRSEPSGLEQTPRDVVGQIPEAEIDPSEVLGLDPGEWTWPFLAHC